MLMVTELIGFGATTAGAAAVTSIVKQAEATSTTSTITAPADIIAGDMLVLLDRAHGSSLPTDVTPTGWTTLNNQSNGSTTRQNLSYKLAVGTEASSSITGMNGADNNWKIMQVYRPNVAATTLTAGGGVGTITNGDPAAQTITSSAGAAPLVVFGGYGVNDANVIDPRTFTVGGSAAKDGETANSTELYLAWKIYNTSPADVVIDQEDEGGQNTLNGGYVSAS